MIIVRLRGGLGNQLFQYAAGFALARHHNTPLKFDLYYYKKHPYRKFELDKFAFPVDIATREEVHQFTGSNPVIRYVNKRENYLRCPHVFTQPYYHFYEDYFKLPSPMYLNGYFQSEKYFQNIKPELASGFGLATALDDQNKALADQIRATNSISVHVRRGDYTKGVYNSFFGGLTEQYYRLAVSKILSSVENPQFYVFSDDITWCKNNLRLKDAFFVEHNKGDNAYKDLFLMAQCRHNIIANSSFGWWAAWMNANPDKIVIAPNKWFQQEYLENRETIYPCRIYNTKDLIPASWIKI